MARRDCSKEKNLALDEIEELRRLQRLAEQSQRKYFELFNLAPFAYFTMDRNGIILEANDASVYLLGEKNKWRLLSKRFGNYVAMSDQGRWSECRQGVFRSGGRVECELSIQKVSGETIQARMSVMPSETEEGKHRKLWMAVVDITSWKRAEEVLRRDKNTLDRIIKRKTNQLFDSENQLRKAERLSDIGTLAATIAHELRNPLAAIKVAAYNLRKKKMRLLNKSLETIEKKIAESDQIITNLLFYSRIKGPVFQDTNISDLLDEAVNMALQRVSKKRVRLKKEIRDLEGVRIKCDPLQLQEVFNNVLNNAFDAIEEGSGSIILSGKKAENCIEIVVKDNGIGIARETLKRIFDPFFTTKSKGTGLGLTVSKDILEKHGGSLCIKSEKGEGAEVYIKLPIS